jgi:hypothetical protein
MSDLKHQLERSLSKLEPKAETEWDATPAAVLIPLYQEDGDWKLLYTRRTQFLITPVVGVIPWPYPLRTSPTEVARTFGVPIRWLADPGNLEVKEREPLVPGRSIRVYYFKEYEGETIWGVTARITMNLLQMLDAASLPSRSAG